MDVRVDSGPQDGTILVTWIPVTLNITTPGQKVPLMLDKDIISSMVIFNVFILTTVTDILILGEDSTDHWLRGVR